MQLSVFSAEIPWKEIFNLFMLKDFNFKGFYLKPFETVICILSFLIVYYTKFSITHLLFVMAFVGAIYGAFL